MNTIYFRIAGAEILKGDVPAMLRHLASIYEQQEINQDLGASPAGGQSVGYADRTFSVEWRAGGPDQEQADAPKPDDVVARMQKEIADLTSSIKQLRTGQDDAIRAALAAAGRADFDWKNPPTIKTEQQGDGQPAPNQESGTEPQNAA